MTTYGTIPTETPAPPNLKAISKVKERIDAGLGTRRPWTEMIQLDSLTVPASFSAAAERIKTNAVFFRANHVIITLFILFISLLWHPMSLIVFVLILAAWLFLYFLREDPLFVYGIEICDTTVMIILLICTVLMLYLTDVTENIIVALFSGVAVVLVHGTLRNPGDLTFISDEDGFGPPGLLPVGDNTAAVRLKNAASTSFSSS